MNELPNIEWPEQLDKLKEDTTVHAILQFLSELIHQSFKESKYIYFLSLHPPHNVNELIDNLNKCNSLKGHPDRMKIINYGYKSRGWGVLFIGEDILKEILPLFFVHGPENLAIAALRDDGVLFEDSGRASIVANNIMFDTQSDLVDVDYVGLYFECNSLTTLLGTIK